MELFEQITASISSFLWSWPMIILLLGTHLYLTVRLRFPQRKIFTAIRLSFKKDDGSEGDVSQFGALATSDRKSTRLNSSHSGESRMPSSA